ncbi:RNA dependent RNA polymerase-domain-containing protein [Lasiosphaeris hirsuta]|uniref:RNA dependent RNA polymerase-domain-containing protein n=1 Tax=Lasiosphaeris hirsuta TaxID=260670 RepID=A0AA40A9S6_9PEZI|nr:RNA dependent RNA polymerase-domain-containing protein [Lasiosphaeris hirsuta]
MLHNGFSPGVQGFGPSTPQKDNGAVTSIIDSLNRQYNLGIQIPDGILSPSQSMHLGSQNGDYNRWRKIKSVMQFLYYKDNQGLEASLQSFSYEAKADSETWIPRPVLNLDGTPKAQTPGQKLKLQETLLKVLESRKMDIQRTTSVQSDRTVRRLFTDNIDSPQASSQPSFSQLIAEKPQYRPTVPIHARAKGPSPKRPSFGDEEDEESPHLSKRLKSKQPGPKVPYAGPVRPSARALDSVPSRRRLGDASSDGSRGSGAASPHSAQSSSGYDSFHSAGSSRDSSISRPSATDSAVFSRNGSNLAFTQTTTQTTAEPPSPSGARGNTTMTSQSQFSNGFKPLHAITTNFPAADSQSSIDEISPSEFVSSVSMRLAAHPNTAAGRAMTAEPPDFLATITTEEEEALAEVADEIQNARALEFRPIVQAGLPPLPAPPQASNQMDNDSSPATPLGKRPGSSSSGVSTVYQSLPGSDTFPTPRPQVPERDDAPTSLQDRLKNVWPRCPRFLRDAPLAIIWEVTRISMHCNIDLDTLSLRYNPESWQKGISEIWKDLRQHPAFQGKTFPERPSADAFAAALTNFEKGNNAVLMSVNLDYNPSGTGPLYLVDMKPLRFDQSCRLQRKFGGDRFFEILLPSPTAIGTPEVIKTPGGAEAVIRWLTEVQHVFCLRGWRPFFTKDAGYRKPIRDYSLKADAVKPVFKDRVHFFAETGPDLAPKSQIASMKAPHHKLRPELKVSEMLDWLLNISGSPKNQSQPYLKFFSRIQLGLSKTCPALVFEPCQIIHQEEDLRSPTGMVMNDGIGRMSRGVARKIRDSLGLTDLPTAVQGRIGSAKGMWIMCVQHTSDEIWIETYPSQRKWECTEDDPLHRTLEIRSMASELKSAGLNLQLLPVLEDRAKDKAQMRSALASRLTNDLKKEFDKQKKAFKNPLLFRQWVAESSNNRTNRVKHGHVGFDPKRQSYLQSIAWDLQMRKCETLKTKMNITVGQSAYIYMVVDFTGVLEEGEVHMGFSSKFRAESDDLSFTLLAERDILVARSPAHFTSDVQRVRAVFKPELHALKDVIIFSSKGNVPLADKLSGGDYDGDMAWVCWDPEIVGSFQNAEVPPQPDLSRYIKKDKTTFTELVQKASAARKLDDAVYEMISESFIFAMQPNFLGICTNFKEKLCYQRNDVGDQYAVILSTLVGNLVDQSKQGLTFTEDSWSKLRREMLGSPIIKGEPAYKSDRWTGPHNKKHIIDFLKFDVAKPAIDAELAAFHRAMKSAKAGAGQVEDGAHFWDYDLVGPLKSFEKQIEDHDLPLLKDLLRALKAAIEDVKREWNTMMAGGSDSYKPPTASASTPRKAKPGTAAAAAADLSYTEKVSILYHKYRDIDIASLGISTDSFTSFMTDMLEERWLADPEENSRWALLKAATAFSMYGKDSGSPKFVWTMAGRQLAAIKAMACKGNSSSSAGGGAGGAGGGGVGGGRGVERDGALVTMTPLMYAGMGPDQRFVKQYVAMQLNNGSEYPDEEGDEEGEVVGSGWGFGGYDDY